MESEIKEINSKPPRESKPAPPFALTSLHYSSIKDPYSSLQQQDFYLILEEDGQITPSDYLEIALKPMEGKGGIAARNESPKIKPFINKVIQCPLQDLAIPLSGFLWEYSKGNFNHWRPLFLHFDTYFMTYLSGRNDLLLSGKIFEDDAPFPKHAVLQILRVMQTIFVNCHNKISFGGLVHLKLLLASTDPLILIATLETLSALVKIYPSKMHVSGKMIGCGSVNGYLLSLADGWGRNEEGLGLFSFVMANETTQVDRLSLFPSDVESNSDKYQLGPTLYLELHGNAQSTESSGSSSLVVINMPDFHLEKEDDLKLMKRCIEEYMVPPEISFSLKKLRYARAFQSSDAHEELMSFFANEPEYFAALARAFCSSLRGHLKEALSGFDAVSGSFLLEPRMTPDCGIFPSLFRIGFLLLGRVHREVLWQISLLDSCNSIFLNCLYGHGSAPASSMETDDGNSWMYGPLASYGKLMDHLGTSSFIVSPFTKQLLAQPLATENIPFPRDAETFDKVQHVVLKAVLPVWTHPQFVDCSYDFISTAISIIGHIYSGIEIMTVNSSSSGARIAGPSPNETTISTIVEMGFSKTRAETALKQVGSNSVELTMEWLFSHPEEVEEDGELAHALAMSFEVEDTKEAGEMENAPEEKVELLPIEELLSTCTKLLQMKEPLAIPLRDLLVMIFSQIDGECRPNIISFILDRVKESSVISDSGNSNLLSAIFHVLALILHEDAVAREIALKNGFVKIASDVLSQWDSCWTGIVKREVPKWVTTAFLAIDRLLQGDEKLNSEVSEQQAMEFEIKHNLVAAANTHSNGMVSPCNVCAAQSICQVEMVGERPCVVLLKDRDKDKTKEREKVDKDKTQISDGKSFPVSINTVASGNGQGVVMLNFSENCAPDILTRNLDGIVSKLPVLLQNGKRMVQEGTSTSLASVAADLSREHVHGTLNLFMKIKNGYRVLADTKTSISYEIDSRDLGKYDVDYIRCETQSKIKIIGGTAMTMCGDVYRVTQIWNYVEENVSADACTDKVIELVDSWVDLHPSSPDNECELFIIGYSSSLKTCVAVLGGDLDLHIREFWRDPKNISNIAWYAIGDGVDAAKTTYEGLEMVKSLEPNNETNVDVAMHFMLNAYLQASFDVPFVGGFMEVVDVTVSGEIGSCSTPRFNNPKFPRFHHHPPHVTDVSIGMEQEFERNKAFFFTRGPYRLLTSCTMQAIFEADFQVWVPRENMTTVGVASDESVTALSINNDKWKLIVVKFQDEYQKDDVLDRCCKLKDGGWRHSTWVKHVEKKAMEINHLDFYITPASSKILNDAKTCPSFFPIFTGYGKQLPIEPR